MSISAKNAALAALAFVSLAMVASPALAKAKGEGSTVVAIVNGDKILKSDVENVIKMNNVKEEDEAKAFPVIVNQMINEKLIDAAAAKSNIEESPAFKQRLAEVKEQLIKTLFVESYLKDKITDK